MTHAKKQGMQLISIFVLLSALRFEDIDSDVFDDAQIQLFGIEGIELHEYEQGHFELSGQIHRGSDYKRIRRFINKHPEIRNRAALTKEARAALTQTELLDFGFASTSGAGISTSTSILLELLIVEIRSTALERLGTRLGETVSVGSSFAFKFASESSRRVNVGTLDPVRSFLDIALQKGEARIHAKQSVVTQNGKTGEFNAGGEFPLKMHTGHSSRIEYKPFGFFLKFSPQLNGSTQVHLKVSCEVSDIDLGSQVDGLPMVIKKVLKTQILAPLDQIMALGGIRWASEAEFVDRIPGLNAIPVLGRLFRSEDFKNQRSEAYLFITAKKLEEPWLPNPQR